MPGTAIAPFPQLPILTGNSKNLLAVGTEGSGKTAVVASVLAWILPFLSFLGICSDTFSRVVCMTSQIVFRR